MTFNHTAIGHQLSTISYLAIDYLPVIPGLTRNPPDLTGMIHFPELAGDPESVMLNLIQYQDDIGVAACAASLRSDRSGSDSTNDKQLSLASRVSHSGQGTRIHSRQTAIEIAAPAIVPNHFEYA